MVTISHIINQYKNLDRQSLASGTLPFRSTSVGFWHPSDLNTLHKLFSQLNLANTTFLDLGSGDGRVVATASLFTQQATGIEQDSQLHQQATKITQQLTIPNTRFINDDFMNHSWKGYDLIYLYPDTPLHRGVETKLLKELSGSLVICGHHFHPHQLKKTKELTIDHQLFTLFST